MKESSTYQMILEEGRAEGRAQGEILGAVAEAKKVLRLQGDDAFGPPDPPVIAKIEGIEDLARLEKLLKRVRTAASWQELLGPAANPRRGGRRPSS